MRRPPLSLLIDLYRLDRRLKPLSCPVCAAHRPLRVLARDRYLLNVELSICRDCGAVYLARGLVGETSSRFYNELYQRLMNVRGLSSQQLAQQRLAAGFRVNAIRNVTGAIEDIVDIGAGHGFFVAACRDAGSTRYCGIEPGPLQRRFAEDDLGLRGHIQAGDFTAPTAPFRPRIVTLFHVLEHLEDPGATLDVIAAWLAPDGWLVIEVPDLQDWSEIGLQYAHVSHRSYFTAASLTALLARHGFRVQETQRELHGIHPTNLRIFARIGAADADAAPPADPTALRATILRQMRPWRLADGYLRSVWRLARQTLAGA